ncbi:flavodoxin [compost metagenome]
MRAFLSAHDLTGKTLIPFNTHGGYGLGNSRSVLVEHAPKVRLLEGFVMESEQERKTMERVNGWLSNQPSTR